MKNFFAILTLLITLSTNGQVPVGFFAGPQLTGARYLVNGEKQETSPKLGFNAGAISKIPFEGRLYFTPSVMYNLRGYKVDLSSPSYPPDRTAIDNNTSFHTLELAFMLQHDLKNDPDHFFFRIGPSLDFALFGREKYHTASGEIKHPMKFGFGEYGHYLASAIFQFGYEKKSGLFGYAYYNYSLTSMNNADFGPKIGNRAAGITIGKYLTVIKPGKPRKNFK
jgi:hypothetical protein